jgi:hypothetical protein
MASAYCSQALLQDKEAVMSTLLMVIASAFIVCGLLVAVVCLQATLSDTPNDL